MRTNQFVNFALGLALSSLIFFAELVFPWGIPGVPDNGRLSLESTNQDQLIRLCWQQSLQS